ncbi:MAG: DUF3280 domain-containing protein [Candidatus Thiodiazotropha sp. (ex Cardiolucina cf. quadrata)]|nr:DUF3280 domain-containing protein [Candidatus Thiodiazotropha sp. (ex Cardiolucina cf. quadrata)]
MNILKYYPGSIEGPKIVQLAVFMAMIACILSPAASKAAQRERLVVLPFEIVDNTPVPGGDTRHRKMLEKITGFIGETIEHEGIFDVVSQQQVNDAVNAARLGTYIHTCNHCEYDLAEMVEGDKVMIGWIYKMSMLILTMHIEVKDVESKKTVISKAYDFRGDNEKAWLRAARYMVRDLGEMFGK